MGRNLEGDGMTADVDALTEQAGLGGLRRTFRPARPRLWSERTNGERVLVVFAVVAAFGVLGTILFMIISAVPLFGLFMTVTAGGLFAASSIRYTLQQRADKGREIRIHDSGVAVVGTGGATVDAYRWESMSVLQDITEYHRGGAHMRTTHVYTFAGPGVGSSRVKGGTVGAFENPGTWGGEIQQQVTAAQLPLALAAVQAGQTLQFGPYTVSAERLTAGSKAVGWSEVQAISTEKGHLTVKRQGRWLNMTATPVRRIPNFFVFRTLADRLVESAAGRPG
ncbi:hypothetical protein OG500_21280 [Kitasatospora sp. NBC_01250]|uniref:DUF6585 family protein n=1 Tax=Kitasatospora sp. NBC_01250 TaxID=2903571 RepID=UPI002E36566B|nr:DUF6585 family protein [Kitasatospora sp. NBC_01250]